MKNVFASSLFLALDGTTFALSSGGLGLAMALTAVSLLAENPTRFTRTFARSSALVIVGRVALSLVQLCKTRRQPKKLESIWDWQPPDTETAAIWLVIKELIWTFDTVKAAYPEIQELLENTPDLPQRLWYYAASDVDEKRAREEQCASSSIPLSEDDGRALELLREYRELAVYAYDCTGDRLLEERLSPRGFTLIGAKYGSDESSPAFYLAMNASNGEIVLVIRGTYSGNDVVTDLVAAGAPFFEGYAHAGMVKASQYLHGRFADVFDAVASRGKTITICGHSLGAGVAALLTHSLCQKRDDNENIRCLCFEPPACIDATLAEASAGDRIFSIVNRDDLVPRLAPTPIVNMLHHIRAFDWRAAAERDGGMVKRISMLFSGDSAEGSTRQPRLAPGPNEQWAYDPVVPGRIFFVRPGAAPTRIDRLDPTLRSLRLTRYSVEDHFVDTTAFAERLADV